MGGYALPQSSRAPTAATVLPNATFSDTYVRWLADCDRWAQPRKTSTRMWSRHYCRICHIQRGIAAMDDLNFDNYCTQTTSRRAAIPPIPDNSYFHGYADRIKAHVIDRGNMPLGKDRLRTLLGTATQPDTLATFLESQGQTVRDSSGAVLTPGRPVADPGPDRTTDSPATLSAANSLYASTYTWSIVSGTGGSLTNANSAQATLTGPAGTYVVQLVVGNGTTQSAPVQVNVTIATPGTRRTADRGLRIFISPISRRSCRAPFRSGCYRLSYSRRLPQDELVVTRPA